MKKIIGMFHMIVFLVLVIIGGTFLQNNLNKQEPIVEDRQISEEVNTNYDFDTVSSELPIILINTKDQNLNKETTIWSEISVVDNVKGNNHQDGEPDFTTAATIKYRGNSSYYNFDKRQFRIKFYKKSGSTKEVDYSLCGMAEDSEWVLNGPFLDRTLIRNHLLYGISRDIMDWAPDSRYCEVFVDGNYEGVYLAVEPVTNGAGRLRLGEFGLLSGQTPYIIKRDRLGTEINVLNTYGEKLGLTGQELSVQYPASKNLTDVQYKWIEGDVSAFEEVLYSDYFADPDIGYRKYIDVESFVDYYIINELSMIVDAGLLSTYSSKELGGKLNMVVWDFNNGFDNYPWEDKDYNRLYVKGNWYRRLLQDRAFVDQVIERYDELRHGVLSNKQIYDRINADVIFLGDAVERNFEVWGYTFNQKLLSSDLEGNSRDPRSYEDAINMLKDTINNRLLYLDNHLVNLYDNVIN